MNRRSFLNAASLLIAGAAIDPELLVWTPKPMITVPAMPTGAVWEVIAAPLEVWYAPVGEAFPLMDVNPAGNWMRIGTCNEIVTVGAQ
jgi:hypothetical protein